MVMDADHGSAEQSFPHSEAFVSQGDLLTPAEEPGSSSSLSSSSTGSSLSASFFRVDESKTHEEEKSFTSLSTSGELASKEGINEDFPNTSGSFPSLSGWEQNSTDATQSSQFSCTLSEQVPNDSQPNSEEFCQGSSESTQNLDEVSSGEESNPGSPGSLSTTSTQTESAMQSPLVQVMERPNVTSAYRIPSHVFERSKSTNPAEWSVASNESLFSIQVGNSSFSRDHVFRVGRSGELAFPNNPEDRVYSKSPLSPIPAVDAENRGSDLEEALGLLEAAVANTTKEVNRAAENRNKPKVKIAEGTCNSSSHDSEGSGTSANSSAFPMKKRKKRKKGCEWLCCCFKCCRPCCDCAWPSCSRSKCIPGWCCDCAWPSCSCSKCSLGCCNYTWPSCSCSKYGSSTCCHTWSCCSCSNFTPTCCHCGWPSCSCSKCFQACSPCSCSSWCQPCSCCTWPSCSSCFSCCTWPSCSSCFSCCWPCWHCKWPSCNCCQSRSSCKWPSCPCSSCSLMCCKWPWSSCFGSNCCRSCHFKSPACCLPNCSGCCCHCTGVTCYRCNCTCTVCIYKE